MRNDFDPSKILKVSIDKVEPNDYNPKLKNTEEYKKVVQSIKQNGLKQFVFVREVEGNDNFIIVDGEQRFTAAKELGYKELYVYNLGEISEEEAKALTIWFEVQVPFDDMQLAPLAVELSDLNVELPFSEDEMFGLKDLSNFDVEELQKPERQTEEDGLEVFTVRMTKDQLQVVQDGINLVVDNEGVSEGRALALLCGGWEDKE